MNIVKEFSTQVTAAAADLPGPELLPDRLARACAQVLPVDGAGISLFFAADRRLPLGASDEVSARAERLQFTLGEGPCLSAHAAGEPLVVDEAAIRTRWPAFHDDLVGRTPFRGIISLPLEADLHGVGALDLYLLRAQDLRAVSLSDALAVTHELAACFTVANGRTSPRADGPAWLDAPAAARRSLVWQAMGFVNAGLGVTSADALAIMRAHAYGAGQELDDLAQQVLDRVVPLQRLSLDAEAHG